MGMIGNQLAAGTALTVANDSFNGTGSATAFTLSQTVSATTDIEVLVDNVQQSPYDSSYSVSGTTLTFSAAPAAGTNNIYVIYNASKHISTNQVVPDDGSVTHAKLHTDMDLSTKNVNPITMSTGTNKMQMAIQSAVSNRFAIRSTHTADYDNNPFIVYQPSGAGHQNDALVINTGGQITKAQQPAFHAGLNSASGSNGAYVSGYVLHADTGNHFNASTGIFTAPVAGKYFFTAFFMTNNSASTIDFSLHVNDTDYHYMVPYQASGSLPNYNHAGGSCIVALSANDTVRIRNNNTALYGSSGNGRHSGFSGFLIG